MPGTWSNPCEFWNCQYKDINYSDIWTDAQFAVGVWSIGSTPVPRIGDSDEWGISYDSAGTRLHIWDCLPLD